MTAIVSSEDEEPRRRFEDPEPLFAGRPLSFPIFPRYVGAAIRGTTGPENFGARGLTPSYLAGLAAVLDEQWLLDRPELAVERRAYSLSGLPFDDEYYDLLQSRIESLWPEKIAHDETCIPFYIYVRTISGLASGVSGTQMPFRWHTVQLRFLDRQQNHPIMVVGNTHSFDNTTYSSACCYDQRILSIEHFMNSFGRLFDDEPQPETRRAASEAFTLGADAKSRVSWPLNLEIEAHRSAFNEILASAHHLANNFFRAIPHDTMQAQNEREGRR